MSQLSFSETEHTNKKHVTRREQFLTRTEKLIPWQTLENKLSAHYPRKGNGRPAYLNFRHFFHNRRRWYSHLGQVSQLLFDAVFTK